MAQNSADIVSRKLYALDMLAHANHVNTRSYAAHKAFGTFYEFVNGFKDRVIEYMMGKGKLVSVKVAVVETGEDLVGEATMFADMFYEYASSCEDEAMENMAAEFTEAVGKLKYMLMLK